MLWEGVGAMVKLKKGPATISLIIDESCSANSTASTVRRDGGTADAVSADLMPHADSWHC